MPKWKHKIVIRQFINEDRPLKENAQSIFNVLDSDPHFIKFLEKYDFKDCAENTTANEFDDMLEPLYDFCDEHRIWITL